MLNALSDKEKKRQEVIFELLQTEKDYVRDLDIIITASSLLSNHSPHIATSAVCMSLCLDECD